MILIGAPYRESTTLSQTTLELINYTDKTVIPGTAITSDVYYDKAKAVISSDFYSSFPKGEVDLGVKLSSSAADVRPYSYGDILLILYRK